MELSSELIINELKNKYFMTIKGKVEQTLKYSNVMLANQGFKASDGIIYIGINQVFPDLQNRKSQSMFITNSPIIEDYEEHFECVLYLNPSVDLIEITNILLNLFHRYNSWIATLNELTQKRAPLEDFAKCSQIVFQNPILIHDIEFNYLAYEGILTTKTGRDFLKEYGKEELIQASITNAEYRATFQKKEIEIFSAEPFGISALYKNIFDHDMMVCRVIVAYIERPFWESDKLLLDILVRYIQLQINSEIKNQAMPLTLSNILYDILDEKIDDDFQIEQMFYNLGWKPEDCYFCIKFVPEQSNLNSNLFINLLKALLPTACSFYYDNSIVSFIHLTQHESQKDVVGSCVEFIRDYDFKVGISDVMSGKFNAISLMFKETSIALRLGQKYNIFQWIHWFKDYKKNYLLEQCTKELPVETIISPEIMEIWNYDRIKHSKYLFTLKTYLNTNMHLVKTAEKLFIHKTTLLYRIERMEKLFAIQLDDEKERLFYQISILLLEEMRTVV